MSMKSEHRCLRIRGGRLLDPATGTDRIGDLCIAEGRIIALGETPSDFTADETIDANGLWVCPGLIDLSNRVREPGEEHKGTIASETRAAASGGVTTLVVPPDTVPPIDNPSVVELIRDRAKDSSHSWVLTLGAMTVGLQGQQLTEMGALRREGVVGVSNGLEGIRDTRVLRRALEYAATQELPVFIQPQDAWLSEGGCAHEGAVATRLGLPGIPSAAEAAEVSRVLALIRLTHARVHFCRLSNHRALSLVAEAIQQGLPVTCDVAAHQLYLTEMDLSDYNPNVHLQPPLRTQRDLQALRTGLGNGTVSAICSDHQPHDLDAKSAPFMETEAGASTVETLLPLVLRLAEEGELSLLDALACVTQNPAQILGLEESGSLAPGHRADVILVDPEAWWTVDTDQLLSEGKNSPFLGWELKGRVRRTLLAGRTLYELI
jgi:dihydroorotase